MQDSNSSIETQVLGRFRSLPIQLQKQVLDFIEALWLWWDTQREKSDPIEVKDHTHTTDKQWDSLNSLIKDCQIKTGISDLAHQHDHYQHHTPKREND